MYSIIILSKSGAKFQGACEAIRLAGITARIILIDDGIDMRVLPRPDFMPCVGLAGEKPFIFARNVNQGIRFAGPHDDVLLLNDDARIETSRGFNLLASVANSNREYGVVSALIDGLAAAPDQCASGELIRAGLVDPYCVREVKHHMLAFVAVYIRRAVIERIGLLDERFIGYGWEDDDYCRRLTDAGLKLGVAPGCIVEHGMIPSEYRGLVPGGVDLLDQNRRIYNAKWGEDR